MEPGENSVVHSTLDRIPRAAVWCSGQVHNGRADGVLEPVVEICFSRALEHLAQNLVRFATLRCHCYPLQCQVNVYGRSSSLESKLQSIATLQSPWRLRVLEKP